MTTRAEDKIIDNAISGVEWMKDKINELESIIEEQEEEIEKLQEEKEALEDIIKELNNQ